MNGLCKVPLSLSVVSQGKSVCLSVFVCVCLSDLRWALQLTGQRELNRPLERGSSLFWNEPRYEKQPYYSKLVA